MVSNVGKYRILTPRNILCIKNNYYEGLEYTHVFILPNTPTISDLKRTFVEA